MSHLDHQLTSYLRSLGESSLPFWKGIAAKGMWGFVVIWIFVVFMQWMSWWTPLLPLILSYITLLIAQAIIKRERPNFEKISGYKMWIRTYSFPSGHATESAVFAGMLMLSPVYPSLFLFLFFSFFLALIAGLVMLSRIAVGVHYVTDILAGCALGALYVFAFTRFF